MRIATMLLMLLSLVGVAEAGPPVIQKIEVDNVGIYTANGAGSMATSGAATGQYNFIANAKLVTRTTKISAAKGVNFGYRYKIVGQPANANVPLRFVTRYPSPGVRNPATGHSIMEDETTIDRAIGKVEHDLFLITEDWEVVPGVWTLEIWFGDKKLASTTFTLTKQ